MSDNDDAIRRKISELRLSSDGLQQEIHNHESMIFAGQEDPRHILRIGECYKQISDNSYEEGKLAAKLEFLQDRAEDRSKNPREQENEKRWETRGELRKADQENWWRDEKSSDREELVQEPDPNDDRYNR